ncbi:MAG: aminoacylase [Gammaproteobacteria bacterium]|nr:aminoacylase [Gammaproteobacteria bacterium]
MAQFDTLIKNGTIVDGTRAPRFQGDLAIRDGKVVAISRIGIDPTEAARVIDARGLVVAPGFVDLHTHYDAQIQWDPYCTLSGWHGVTSLVLGNCGFGFAPVAPDNRDRMMLSMSRVEAIPFEAMKKGMLWDWVTFPEWLDTLARIPKGVNVISYVPIGPVMIWVMGLEEAKRREPTSAELAEMCQLIETGMDAGACGWSVQHLGDGFTSVQRDYDGTPMVTDIMSNATCLAFAEVLRKRGEGHIQITQAQDDIREDLVFVEKLAEVSGTPVLFNVVNANNHHPRQSRRLLEWAAKAQAKGIKIYLQAVSVGNDLTYTFEDFNLLDGQEDWREVTLGTVAERMRKMQDPARRAGLRLDYDIGRMPIVTGPIKSFVILETIRPEHKCWQGMTVQQLGDAQGRHPIDALLDLVIAEQLQTVIFTPAFNDDVDLNREIFQSEYTVPGVSDGGAHTKFVTLGRYTTEFLADFVRDKHIVDLEEAHYRLSCLPAKMAGFLDRGVLAEGRPADVVIYDFEALRSTPSEIAHDFPGGEWRRVQRAEGYRYILVNGEITFEDGVCTGATPGKLLRHGHA